MIPHLSPIIESVAGGVLTVVVWEGVKYVWRAVRRDTEESRVARLLKQQTDLLQEVQKERTECTEKREKAEKRIDDLEKRNDSLEADVTDLKEKIDKQAHEFQNELRLANEAGRLAMVSAQGNDDGRRLAEARLTEAKAQASAAHAEAVHLRAIIHAIDPEHPEAVPLPLT